MTENDLTLPLRVTRVCVGGKRSFDPADKQRLLDACLQPGASLSCLALKVGVNANQLHMWVQLREQSTAQARGNTVVGLPPFVPVVAIDAVAPVSATALAARPTHKRECADPSPPVAQGARLSARLPNGVMLELECSGHDAAILSAMIAALGAR